MFRTICIVTTIGTLVFAGTATAQGPTEPKTDPVVQGECPGGDDGQGFNPHVNPPVDAWPVYEQTSCTTDEASGSSSSPGLAPVSKPVQQRTRRARRCSSRRAVAKRAGGKRVARRCGRKLRARRA